MKEVFLRVLFSDTIGYKLSFTVPFDCNREILAAEGTNVDGFNCSFRYFLNSFEVSLFSTLSVAPESRRKSFSRCGGEIVFV